MLVSHCERKPPPALASVQKLVGIPLLHALLYALGWPGTGRADVRAIAGGGPDGPAAPGNMRAVKSAGCAHLARPLCGIAGGAGL
ncbi:MAG: hypothetical protein H3C33_13680 [Rhodocyclaceae bacterium]|nr:hypothetical protein [Rhodocyclaceae bacterium]